MSISPSRGALVSVLVLSLAAPLGGILPADARPERSAARSTPRQIDFEQWTTTRGLASGRLSGVRASNGLVRLGSPVGTRTYVDPHRGTRKTYAFGRWTSRWTAPGFALTELVPSWDATTPGDSWVQIAVRGRAPSGRRSSWDTIANWSREDPTMRRTSLGSQSDDLARVAVDTLVTHSASGLASWQLRVTLLRRKGTDAVPTLDMVGAMASRLPQVNRVRTSRPGVARGVVLNVPEYSQMTHRGHYPQFGNGGEAWCSPTSTSMVLGYYHGLPERSEYAWVRRSPDRFVDHAARMTYDYEYDGTGNWPFNTAYAATYVKSAFVTRLRSLREAERFTKARIPLVASIAFGRGELDGAPIGSSNGHLLVIAGFTRSGDVVVNDPAAASNRTVRRVYDRGQFENAWVPKSGGLVYVIRTKDRDLPERTLPHSW